MGAQDEDLFTSLANRLVRLEKQLTDDEKSKATSMSKLERMEEMKTAPFSRYAQHLHPRSVRIQRHRVNTGRSLPSQIGALPIGILNRHLGQQFGLLVFGRVKIEELIFHISFKIADSNLAPSVVSFLNDCNRASIVIFAERRAVRRFFRAQIQSIR